MYNKNISVLFLLLFLFSLLLNSCATFDLAGLKATEKVAVLTVYCDKRLDISDFETMAAAVSALAQNEGFDLQPTVQTLKTKIMVDCAPSFPFTFIDERLITGSEVYNTFDKDNPFAELNPLIFALPTGYKVIPDDTPAIKKAASGFPSADAFMFVFVNYKLHKQFELLGFGTANIQATITLTVKDKAGKLLMQRYETAYSTEDIKFALGGVFDASKIRPLCDEATNIALDNISAWIQKELTK